MRNPAFNHHILIYGNDGEMVIPTGGYVTHRVDETTVQYDFDGIIDVDKIELFVSMGF